MSTTTMEHEQRADAFAERMFETTLGMMEGLTVAIGSRLGFYRSLADEGPATSKELAARTDTAERYAREWLEQQTIAGVLEVDDATAEAAERRYALPPPHADVLVDRDSLRYMAPMPTAITAAALQFPALIDAYKGGGGVSWNDFGDLIRQAQADQNRPLFLHLLPDMLAGIDDIGERLRNGGRVADIGCGFGWSAIGLARVFPEIAVDGYDLDTPSIEAARVNASEAGVADRVTFHDRDAGDPSLSGTYDLAIACECVHDMPDPVSVLASMRRLVGDDGTVVVVDEGVAEDFGAVGDPIERVMYGFSTLVCLPDGLASEGSVGTGTVMRPATLEGYARQGGFNGIEILPIEHDVFRFYRLVG
ncbi:MAG: class I SAM-dependent methyltransferase [Actinomycetota bacterium]